MTQGSFNMSFLFSSYVSLNYFHLLLQLTVNTHTHISPSTYTHPGTELNWYFSLSALVYMHLSFCLQLNRYLHNLQHLSGIILPFPVSLYKRTWLIKLWKIPEPARPLIPNLPGGLFLFYWFREQFSRCLTLFCTPLHIALIIYCSSLTEMKMFSRFSRVGSWGMSFCTTLLKASKMEWS